MKYGIQMQTALDRLDQSLARLHTMVKRGETANAVEYMERGELKDRFEELQNIVTVAVGPVNKGASGAVNTGMFNN